MRLLQISADCNTGSVGRIMDGIGSAVMKRGGESYIAYGRDFRPTSSKVIRIGGVFNTYAHAIVSRIFDCDGLGSKCATSIFLKNIKSIDPDIIHIHCIHGYYLNYPLLFKYIKDHNKALIWTFHDCWPFTGHCCFPTYRDCEGYKTGCISCSWKKDYPSSYLLSRSRENFELKKSYFLGIDKLKIITVSNWLKDEVKSSFFSSREIETIYNGVDLTVFRPYDNTEELNVRSKYSINQNCNYIIGVASPWSERKGFSDYLKLRKVLDVNLLIVLVGLSAKQIDNLPQGVIGIPRISDVNDLAKLYSSATVVMNLSSAETFGMTTAEGFACGTPCVGYNCTATPELITNDTGFIVNEGDIEGLKTAINSILRKGKSYYSFNCRKRAEDLFDKDKCFSQYVDLYYDLVK